MKRVAASFLWIVAALCVVLASGCGDDGEQPGAFLTPPSTAELIQPGPFAVGTWDATLVDESRPTMANGSFPGAPNRRLPTRIWYPAEASLGGAGTRAPQLARTAGPLPLVVYSHGFLGTRSGGRYLAEHLASHGYVVVAADFPLTNFSSPGGATLADLANQPGDVRFLISTLLAGNVPIPEAAALAQKLRADAIGLLGLSLGGATTLLATFHPSLHDPRVRASVAHAPVACFLGQRFFATRSVPLLILHGDIDAIVPYEANAVRAFQRALLPKYLVTLRLASHTAFTDGAETLFGQVDNADNVGCAALLSALSSGNAMDLTAGLGGVEAGIVAGGCPLPCPLGLRNPPSMRPARQHELTIAATFAHFEAWLRGRAEMLAYLEGALGSENADARVEWARN